MLSVVEKNRTSKNEQHQVDGQDGASSSKPINMYRDVHEWSIDSLMGVEEPVALNLLDCRNPVALCAEPGMGKTHTMMTFAQRAKAQGRDVITLKTHYGTSEDSFRRFVRACRDVARRLPSCHDPLVLADDIEPLDERAAYYEARALNKLIASGCQIVMCLRPEAEQLIELIPNCLCLRSSELLFRFEDDTSMGWELTGGIPSLVTAYRADSQHESTNLKASAFEPALEALINDTLRRGLPNEEARVRLAMILLGRGTLEEVHVVSGRCDLEQFAWLRRDVPLFGVGERDDTFECHGISDDRIFRGCVHVLQSVAASEPKLVVRACGILATRGDIRRSAILCSLLSTEQDFAEVGLAWGALYAMAGEIKLVEEAVRVARTIELAPDVRGVLSQAAIVMLTRPSAEVVDMREHLETLELSTMPEQESYRHVLLLSACREVCRNPRHAMPGIGTPHDDLVGAPVIVHVHVAKLLASGRFSEAYARLSNNAVVHELWSIPAALLCDDLYLALLLSGGMPDKRERQLFDTAQRFFAQSKMGHLQVYHEALGRLPDVLVGPSCDIAVLEDAAHAASRVGDRFLQALFLAVMAISDVRSGALSRAHVRAEKAGSLARAIDEAYLASAAELVDAISLSLLGETGVLGAWCEREGRPADLAMLGRLCARVSGELPQDDVEVLAPTAPPFPRDALWLLRFIVKDCRSISEAIGSTLPINWYELLNAITLRQEGLYQDGPTGGYKNSARESAHERLQGHALREGEQRQLLTLGARQERVRVSVMGGFKIEIDGQTMSEGLLDRRRARDLVMLLAIVPTHRLRRYQIVETLWPDYDYVRGPRKLYEATGEARKRLGSYLDGLNPILADRSQGSIGYDLALVGCDVDEFEREARLTLSDDDDDFGILDHARRMERLYASGPDAHLEALGDRVVERLDELKTMYIDGAIAAGEAALRLGKAKLAVHFAKDAHRMGDLREDAMILLIHALRAAGRGFEVTGLYRRFSRHLIDVEGVPPSLALRNAAALASKNGGAARTA